MARFWIPYKMNLVKRKELDSKWFFLNRESDMKRWMVSTVFINISNRLVSNKFLSSRSTIKNDLRLAVLEHSSIFSLKFPLIFLLFIMTGKPPVFSISFSNLLIVTNFDSLDLYICICEYLWNICQSGCRCVCQSGCFWSNVGI